MYLSRTRTRWLAVAATAIVGVAVLPATLAHADPVPGSLSGRVVDGTTPVAGASVLVLDAETSNFVAFTNTNGGGEFGATVAAGAYKVEILLPGGLDQWIHQADSFEEAQVITVAEGTNTAIADEAVRPHGALAGHVTDSAGVPMAGASVVAQPDSGGQFLNATTNGSGAYVLPFVAAGSYILSFRDPTGSLTQQAHQKVFPAEPDHFTVTVGATTTVDEQFLATGAVTGRLTDRGQPVAFARVSLNGDAGASGSGFTDVDGRFRVSSYPGRYAVGFDLPSGLRQYAHGKFTERQADRVVVSAGADTVVDEQVAPHGMLAGRLTDSAGLAVPFAQVQASNATQSGFTSTDGDGRWHVDAFTGSYRVAFSTNAGVQYGHGKRTLATADLFTVADGQTTTVDETLAATGTVTVTVRNAVTHAPVSSFCAGGVGNDFSCTDSGSITLTGLPGSYTLYVSSTDDSLLVNNSTVVAVESGQSTSVTVDLQPAAVITTTVRDARTGAPLADICLEAIPTDSPTSLGVGGGVCSDASGTVRIGSLSARSYNVFAWARDGVHGHQWVGTHGGQGAMAKARVVTLTAGQTVSLPAVRMDKRGTLTGIVMDKRTHAPMPGTIVGLSSSTSGFGGTGAETSTDAGGRYTFSDLGPYEWVVLFHGGDEHAYEWTGHESNRLKAKGVKVKAGKTTTFNIGLSTGVTLTGLITDSTGAPMPEFGTRVSVIQANSHDEIGVNDNGPDGRYSVHLLGKASVKLEIQAFFETGSVDIFYVNASTFDAGATITMPRHAPKTVDITLPPPS